MLWGAGWRGARTCSQLPLLNNRVLSRTHAHMPASTCLLSCRYIANDTPGTKGAKLRLLQQRGWVVLPLKWVEK